MAQQYVSHAETGGEQGREEGAKQFGHFARNFVKRSLGVQFDKTDKIVNPPKRRRVKTFLMCHHINNMIRGAQPKTLADYVVMPDATGAFPDPFSWPSLGIAPDRGADMVCTDHFLSYEMHVNLSCDYDPSHDAKCSGKGALHRAKLWSHAILMSAGHNCVYGSSLSPPRLAQIRECVEEYFETRNPTDEFFQMFLPFLVEQLKLGVSLGDDGCEEVMER